MRLRTAPSSDTSRAKGAAGARDVLCFLPSRTAHHHREVAGLPYEATHREGAEVEDGLVSGKQAERPKLPGEDRRRSFYPTPTLARRSSPSFIHPSGW